MVNGLPTGEYRSPARRLISRITPDVTPLEIAADKFALNSKPTGQELPKQASTPPPVSLPEKQVTVPNASVAKLAEAAPAPPFYPEPTVKNSTSLQEKDEVPIPDWAKEKSVVTPLEKAEEIVILNRLGKLQGTTSRAEEMEKEERKRMERNQKF